jgi:hypothetical protein
MNYLFALELVLDVRESVVELGEGVDPLLVLFAISTGPDRMRELYPMRPRSRRLPRPLVEAAMSDTKVYHVHITTHQTHIKGMESLVSEVESIDGQNARNERTEPRYRAI